MFELSSLKPEKTGLPKERRRQSILEMLKVDRKESKEEAESILATREITKAEQLNNGNVNSVMLVHFKDDGKGIYKPKTGEDDFSERPLLPGGTFFQRERAGYLVDDFLHFNLVPPTVIREEGVSDGVGSVQRFAEGNLFDEVALDRLKQDPAWESLSAKEAQLRSLVGRLKDELLSLGRQTTNHESAERKDNLREELKQLELELEKLKADMKVIESKSEAEVKEEYKPGLMKLWLYDLITQNNDRHVGNLFFTKDKKIVAIDQGLCFNGTVFKTFGNYFGEKLPPEVAQLVLDIEKRPNWAEELRGKMDGLLNEMEIDNLIHRLQKIIGFIKADGVIPAPARIGKYSTDVSDMTYFECYEREEYN